MIKKVKPSDVCVGDKVQFDGEVGTVVSNSPKPNYGVGSHLVEISFPSKSVNFPVLLKGSDSMQVVGE